MTKLQIMKTVSGSLHKGIFKVKKHSPEILIVTGVIGAVVSVVMACKATTKVNSVLDKSKKDIDIIHETAKDETLSEEYTPEDVNKDLTIVYVKTGVEIVKLYAPAFIVGAISLAGIITSNNILRQRNVAIAAAYATVDTGFKQYRKRVTERFGEEVERELRHNVKASTIEKTVIDENGEEQKVTETIQVTADPNEMSDYARFFDDGCTGWEKDSEYNLMFLRAQQQYANDKLKAEGILFLNDVYDMLGIPKTKAGQVVGWIYDPDTPVGDNYVDFGIYDANRQTVRDFVNGYERTILLDFNVDGNIWNRM